MARERQYTSGLFSAPGFVRAARLCHTSCMKHGKTWLIEDWSGAAREALAPVFEAHPPEIALQALVVQEPAGAAAREAVAEALKAPCFASNPAAASALWLYADELDRSHTLSQSLHTATGSFLHGIMHRREGDFGNSLYWMGQTGSHPVWESIPGYDPRAFIRAVEARTADDDALVALQRAEWCAILAHALRHGAR